MKPRFPVTHLLMIILAALIAGCSTTGTSTGSVVTEGVPEPGVQKPVTPATLPPPAVVEHAPYADLLKRAGTARDAGDYEQALALLERAQRIDPDSAEIYLALAQTHRARGDLSQARATAERGLLYCGTSSLCDALRAYAR